MRSIYSQILTPEERQKCMAVGVTQKLASHNISADSEIAKSLRPFYEEQDLTKSAQLMDTGLQTLLLTSLVAGIPLGALAHYGAAGSRESNKDIIKRENELRHYRNANEDLQAELKIQG